MKKKMIFYWYVPSCGWYEIYDLHIKNLNIYKDRFDEVSFIISVDGVDDDGYKRNIDLTIDKLRCIFPNAKFIMYKNDKELRESVYFYNEIVMKLNQFDNDVIIFFAHNKGVDSWYANDRLGTWINLMYFENLFNVDRISDYFSKESVCCAGTYTIMNLKAWNFLKYSWHYSGTFFWICPKRILNMIHANNEVIPPNGRYATEGFLGSVIPNDDKYRIAILGRATEVHLGNVWIENNMSSEEKRVYENLYGKLECTTGRSQLFSNHVYKLIK